jgi:hypothetical protein
MKQFKIGEYAIGGIITVETTDVKVCIKALDWFTKKEVRSDTFNLESQDCESDIQSYLQSLTSSYYAGKIMDYINLKVRFLECW